MENEQIRRVVAGKEKILVMRNDRRNEYIDSLVANQHCLISPISVCRRQHTRCHINDSAFCREVVNEGVVAEQHILSILSELDRNHRADSARVIDK